MSIPSSGPISLADINVELGRDFDATIGMSQAESGNYDTINTNNANANRPNGSAPHSIDEWYGYWHGFPALNSFNGGGRGNTEGSACSDANSANRIYYSADITIGVNSYIYTDNTVPTLFNSIGTNYAFIYIDYTVWAINSNGMITADAEYEC